MRPLLLLTIGLGLALAGAAGILLRRPAGTPVEPAGPRTGGLAASAPRRLSETGLYAPDGSIAPGNHPYSPQYPLWTDGAAKSRWIRLPEGAKIDVTDVDVWRFPAGTRLWKEFAWNGRKVETRMIWKPDADSFAFATYVWREDQSDADLADAAGIPGAFEFAPGRRHSIPGLADCRACHDASPAVVLGFDALQLSDDRDPLAPHGEPLPAGAITLRSLLAEGRLAPDRRELGERPPRIRSADPVERAAIGYLAGNCGACHNASGPLARLGLDLRHDVDAPPDAPEPAIRTAIRDRSRFVAPGADPEEARVLVPGEPARSVLLHRIRSRRPSSQMPPLGSVVRDEEAVRLVERWIAGLRAYGK